MTRGMVLGKFLPPHLGHVYLVDFARAYADELAVVVGTLASEPIPGALRHAWMRELCPGAHVVHLTDENPQDPSEHPDFWRIWRESLQRVLPFAPDLVFASERYGARLAQELGARFVPVDLRRGAVPTSGTAVRADPMAHFRYLPPCVRPYFVRRVCVFGPESTGKTTLCERLAARFGTVMVPEYARLLLEERAPDEPLQPEDFARIARGQIAAEEALARQADRVLICDTDVLSTAIWAEVLLGADASVQAQALFDQAPGQAPGQAAGRSYDLTLLTDVDVPFVPDPVRYFPAQAARADFLQRCQRALCAHRRPFVLLSGSFEARFQAACDAIEALLRAGPGAALRAGPAPPGPR